MSKAQYRFLVLRFHWKNHNGIILGGSPMCETRGSKKEENVDCWQICRRRRFAAWRIWFSITGRFNFRADSDRTVYIQTSNLSYFMESEFFSGLVKNQFFSVEINKKEESKTERVK